MTAMTTVNAVRSPVFMLTVLLVACVGAVRNPLYCDDVVVCVDPVFSICDPIAHECQSGLSDGGDDLARDQAAPECTLSAACLEPLAPICTTEGRCAACGSDGECLARSTLWPRCQASGACVVCQVATDCSTSAPVCDQGSCRACRSHGECGSAVCRPDGTCVPPADVAYVGHSVSCANSMHASTPANPFCELGPAVASGKSWVVVAGSSTAYATTGVVFSGTTLTLVGPGRAASPSAVLAGTTAPSVQVAVGETITIDGFEITTSLVDAVFCSTTDGSSSLTIHDCFIHGAGKAGIAVNDCIVTVDASIVSGNAGGGIKLASAAYTVTNTIIAGNGSGVATAAGVSIDNGSTGVFAFNTVAKNTVAAGAGGVDCGSGATKSIADSIVWRNTTSAGTQLGPACVLDHVVTVAGDDSRGTRAALAPTFVSSIDFHLVANDSANLACCIDQVAATGTPHADHDVDGHVRPRGGGATPYDIGAHEPP